MKYMLDTNVLMHFDNDERKSYKINKHLDRAGHENIFVSSITIHEVHTKLIKAKVSSKNVAALAAIIAQFDVRNFNSGAAIESANVTAEAALDLVKVLGTSAKLWMSLQATYDLDQAMKHRKAA